VLIEGQTRFDAEPARVWSALLDPAIIAQCVPGCEELTETEPDRFTARLKVGVGPVSGRYEGTLRITEKEPPSRYAMTFEGQGGVGFVRGAGSATLRADAGSTLVAYRCDVEVGGALAAVGQRMLEGASRFLVNQMFDKLRAVVARGSAP
jgi:hypothetical protein